MGLVLTCELRKSDQKLARFFAILAGMSDVEHLWHRPHALLHASLKDKEVAVWQGHPGVCEARDFTAEHTLALESEALLEHLARTLKQASILEAGKH